MKKKKIIIGIVIFIVLVIISISIFVIVTNVKVKKEALINMEALFDMKTRDYNFKKEFSAALSNDTSEIKENDFKILEIRRIDEKKLEKKLGKTINKSDIKNEYIGMYEDESGNYRKKEDTTDYTKYDFFAIKYIYNGKMQIAIYIGGHEYNSSEMEDLGIGSWVRDAWDMDIYTKDKFDVDKIMDKM